MLDAYLSPWQPAAQCLPDGYFWSGDLASRDGEGTVRMHGRSKSVINVGGLKVFPEEVEAALDAHPAISASRVSGAEHPIFGSFPVAELVASDPDAPTPKMLALNRWCEARVASYKVPKRFTWLEEIPRTASGKVIRQ